MGTGRRRGQARCWLAATALAAVCAATMLRVSAARLAATRQDLSRRLGVPPERVLYAWRDHLDPAPGVNWVVRNEATGRGGAMVRTTRGKLSNYSGMALAEPAAPPAGQGTTVRARSLGRVAASRFWPAPAAGYRLARIRLVRTNSGPDGNLFVVFDLLEPPAGAPDRVELSWDGRQKGYTRIVAWGLEGR